MEVEVTGHSEITIHKNIKGIEDFRKIRDAVTAIIESGSNTITLMIPESLSMTSSVIGYFMKLVRHDNKKVAMHIRDKRLYELLEELNLIETFRVKKMD